MEHADFRKWQIDADSGDMFFTDLPYAKEYLPLYSELGKLAKHGLKPGGILMVYAGAFFFDEIIIRLREHLSFVWPVVAINQECSQPSWSRPFFSGHRQIPVFSKGVPKWSVGGRVKIDRYIKDTFQRDGKEKDLHEWQQPVDEAMYYIGAMTQPGDLIIDPCLGSGTTAEAVYRLGGRSFRGCDIEEGCVMIARERISKLQTHAV